nr:hypothetical protein [Candidatus Sigynarchaeota archaeon]
MFEITKSLCPPGWDDIKAITQDLVNTLDCMQGTGKDESSVRPAIARAIADMRAEKSHSIQVIHYAGIIRDFKTFWIMSAGLA